MNNPTTVVAEFFDAWIAGDVDAAVGLLAPDAIYALYIAEDLLPFAGVTRGRGQIASRLHEMRQSWDYERFRPGPLRQDADDEEIVYCSVEFRYRHRPSGEQLSGSFRMVWCVRDGFVRSCEEYHDRARVETFLRLVRRYGPEATDREGPGGTGEPTT